MNCSMITWAELLLPRIGPVAGYCEHCDGFSISIKVGVYVHHLSRRQLLKKDSSPWRSFHFIFPEQNSLLVPSAVAVSYVVAAGAPCLI